jgi:hypothetical protein
MDTITLTMKETVSGSLDGKTTETYETGKTYVLPRCPASDGGRGLWEVFLREGWAEEQAEPAPAPAPAPATPSPAAEFATAPQGAKATTQPAGRGGRRH